LIFCIAAVERAEAMLVEADKIFNRIPGLEPLEEEAEAEMQKEIEMYEVEDENEEDSREERAFRMWFNSLNIEKEVRDLFVEIRDGMILLQAEDKIEPGIGMFRTVIQVDRTVCASRCS
jgi:plastin-1